MKTISIITLFPKMIEEALQWGVLGGAIKKKQLLVDIINPRKFASGVHLSVDDKPFGGQDGMLMTLDPLVKSIQSLNNPGKIILLTPIGKVWNDEKARLSAHDDSSLTFICGRYAGIDQRLSEKFDLEEVSIGDYVLSGGELGALVILDSIARHCPGVLGNPLSPKEESFSDGFLEAPQYTRPEHYKSQEGRILSVPPILLSGNPRLIKIWKHNISCLLTLQKRPELLVLKTDDLSLRKNLFQCYQWALKEDFRNLQNTGLDLDLVKKNFDIFFASKK